MGDRNSMFIGCDVGDRTTEICVLDGAGAVVQRKQVGTTAGALTKALARHRKATVAVEAGTHSRWIEEVLSADGHRVIVANPRQVQLIWKRGKKTDKADALLLARLARVDVSLLAPVQHRSRAAQIDLAAVRSRDLLVRARTMLVNHLRGALKPFAVKPPKCSTDSFPDRVAEHIPTELLPALAPVLDVLRKLNEQIGAHDRQIAQRRAARRADCRAARPAPRGAPRMGYRRAGERPGA
jgi:transposase